MNKDNYKNAINQIHASDELKEKTFEKIKSRKNRNYYLKPVSVCTAMLLAVFVFSFIYINNINKEIQEDKSDNIAKEEIDNLPRFKSIEEIREILADVNTSRDITKGEFFENQEEKLATSDALAIAENSTTSDFSTTNIQVENVDEADIVKTDGNYIYYISNNTVFIVDAKNLEIVSQINNISDSDNGQFSYSELYINNDKLIVLGNYNIYEKKMYRENENNQYKDVARITSSTSAEAIVYDISDKANPKVIREVSLDGNYRNSRMIGDNIYFISTKYANYYEGISDDEILPIIKDSVAVEDTKRIEATDIVYFGENKEYSYILVGGFNINNTEEVNVETFLGASDKIYASENNLYLTQVLYGPAYTYIGCKTVIYKFKLDNSNIKLQCKGEVEGYLNSQFSMDEYENNLRLATTITVSIEEPKEEVIGNIVRTTLGKNITTNNLYVLNENLEEIGKIENLADEEKIYSVRFIGKMGYIVTFQQVDPLFVIDLSDPTNPTIKGELKIPGYSSYLHPYDETHIIGIGNNVKSNGSGGVTTTNMKMSMFDVSDVENPKEIFSVDIGDSYAYSNITYNHKVLLYSKSRNLIGFPVTIREYSSRRDRNGFMLFKIDLTNNKFEKYGEILQEIDYRTNIDRAIYIDDILYTLSNYKIISYDLNTFEKIKELDLPENEVYNPTVIQDLATEE